MAKTNSVDKNQLQKDIEAIKNAKTEKEVDDLTKEFTDKVENEFKAKSEEIMKI